MGLRTFLGLKQPPPRYDQSPPIGGARRRLLRREYERKFPGGNWTERNQPLFDLGIDFDGRTILDAGCNLGIIGYEASKSHPASYHGIDSYQPGLEVARAIFSGVSVEHRFDRVDMGRHGVLARALMPSYDIVLLIRVYAQIVNKHGSETARQTLALLADRCSDLFVATTRDAEEERTVVDTLNAAGFNIRSAIPSDEKKIYGWFVFAREPNQREFGAGD